MLEITRELRDAKRLCTTVDVEDRGVLHIDALDALRATRRIPSMGKVYLIGEHERRLLVRLLEKASPEPLINGMLESLKGSAP